MPASFRHASRGEVVEALKGQSLTPASRDKEFQCTARHEPAYTMHRAGCFVQLMSPFGRYGE